MRGGFGVLKGQAVDADHIQELSDPIHGVIIFCAFLLMILYICLQTVERKNTQYILLLLTVTYLAGSSETFSPSPCALMLFDWCAKPCVGESLHQKLFS